MFQVRQKVTLKKGKPEPTMVYCLVCQKKPITINANFNICKHCAVDIQAAQSHLETRRQLAARLLEQSQDAANAAMDALDGRDAVRWRDFTQARQQAQRPDSARQRFGEPNSEMQRRVETMTRLFHAQDPRISPALLALYHADKRLVAANAEYARVMMACEAAAVEIEAMQKIQS